MKNEINRLNKISISLTPLLLIEALVVGKAQSQFLKKSFTAQYLRLKT